MAAELRTRRWNDPERRGDGTRVLVCRFRPRGVKKIAETWDEWVKEVAPSAELLKEYHAGLSWAEYERRYLEEMKDVRADFFIRGLAGRLAGGESLTLLCSSACKDEQRCHRTLLAALIEKKRSRKA
jgi:uncharacterized protein YeaO (DUF488 family)